MKNKVYSILVCCLVLGFGSVGRAEYNTGETTSAQQTTPAQESTPAQQTQATVSCTDSCAAGHLKCINENKISNKQCDTAEDRCFDTCNRNAVDAAKNERKEKREKLKMCLRAAKDKKLLADQACYKAFNDTPATVGTCGEKRIAAHKLRVACLGTASGTYRADIKACYLR